jgi:hypothetical protein
VMTLVSWRAGSASRGPGHRTGAGCAAGRGFRAHGFHLGNSPAVASPWPRSLSALCGLAPPPGSCLPSRTARITDMLRQAYGTHCPPAPYSSKADDAR